MEALLKLNTSGLFSSGPAQRGFICRTVAGGPARRVRGITKIIKDCYPIRRGDTQRRIKLFSFPAGVVPIASNLRRGQLIHKHISHVIFCATGRTCHCRRLYGSAAGTTRAAFKAEQISVRCSVTAAQRFMTDFRIKPVSAETTICHRTLDYGTDVDGIGERIGAEPLPDGQVPKTLISWKSGQGPRNEIEMKQHAAQLAVEWSIIVGSHNVPIECGYVVYVTAARGTGGSRRGVTGHYQALKLDASKVAELYGPVRERMARRSKPRKKKATKKTTIPVKVKRTPAKSPATVARRLAAAAALARANARKRKQ